MLENKKLSSERLTTIRDIFIFQCYTRLAYIDVFQLKTENIKQGLDGKLWIMSSRQKPTRILISLYCQKPYRLCINIKITPYVFRENQYSRLNQIRK